MRIGKAITVAPIDQMLTAQEAANCLGISRPTLVKLIEAGQIPHERTSGGRHRRVRLQDVVAYQDTMRRRRRSALADLTAEAPETGLYERSAQDCRAALKSARRELSGGDTEAAQR